MKVTALRELLQEMEAAGHGDMDVQFAYNYGDHWRTTVTEDISSCIVATVKYSDYHGMDKLVDTDDEDRTPGSTEREVIILE